MATTPKPLARRDELPAAPEPASKSAQDGMTEGKELARRYWVDLVRLNAAIALSPRSEAALHTRMLAGKEIRELAAGVPQAVPAAPLPHDADGDSREAS